MNETNMFGLAWWKWWGNPLLEIHADHLSSLPFVGITLPTDITEYFSLIQIRSHFELPDLPDEAVTTNPSILAITIAKPEQISKNLMNLAVLTMPSSIIYARPAEWQEKYGIDSADDIRTIIECFRAIPHSLSTWQHCASTYLPDDKKLGFNHRSSLGLGLLLRTFFPNIYQRWVLTQGYDFLETIKNIEHFSNVHWNEIMVWLEPGLNALLNQMTAVYQEADIELNESDIEEFTPLDIDALYGAEDA